MADFADISPVDAAEAQIRDHPSWWLWWTRGDLRGLSVSLVPFMEEVLKGHLAGEGIVTCEQLYTRFMAFQGNVEGFSRWLVTICHCEVVRARKIAYSLSVRLHEGQQAAVGERQPQPTPSPPAVVPGSSPEKTE